MKIWDLFIKNMKEILRDRRNLFFILLFPVIFMLVFGVAFGGSSFTDSTVNLGILNLDEGVNGAYYSNDLIESLDNLNLSNDESLFKITRLDSRSQGEELLQTDTISAILVIPEDYSNSVASLSNLESNDIPTNITLVGDPTSTSYAIASNVISNVLSQYSSNLQQASTGQAYRSIGVVSDSIEGTSSFSLFDYIAPGLIVFAILMNVTSVAGQIAEENEDGLLRRLKLSKMKSRDYILANLCAWLFMGAIQVVILFGVALILGFKWQGGTDSLVLAVAIGIVTTIASVALSLIIVSVTKTANQAGSLATIISVPLSFICGSFFPLPEFVIGTFNGRSVQIYEILPWNQAITAFRQVLTYGQPLKAVLPNIICIIVMGVVLLVISIKLFNNKISAEN
ncbi:MAG: multidrug ABC transporter permease [Methanosphaera sp. rholeuAM74]|nr:MAG: multidrug ABC transporter permease [Methanosphaera sp. rholeuAM74]